ncbi:IS1380 family transposase [Thermodesulfovibrio hydrogeniphilus]
MIKQTLLNFKFKRTDEKLTPHAGATLFTEFMLAFGVKKLIQRIMPSPGSNRGYDAWQYIHPIVLMLLAGGRHIDDLREIAEDKALRESTGMGKVPSSSAVGDWIRRSGNGEGIVKLKTVIDEANRKALQIHEAKEYTLWSDPTIIETEKYDAKMTYKGVKGYKPIVTAFKELPIIVYHEFRHGNVAGVPLQALSHAYELLPEGKRIKHACLDSEFYTAEVINFLRSKGTTFSIVADKTGAVMDAIKRIKHWRELRTEEGILTNRQIGETVHVMKGTEAFRLVVQRWKKEQIDLFDSEPYCYHVIATDSESSAEEVVWEYNKRGQMENIIKELKNGIGMESLPSGEFGGNAMWFCLGVLAYNVFVLKRELILPQEYKNKTISTIRWFFIEIAGKMVKHGRRLWLHVSTTVEKFNLLLHIRKKIMAFV